MYKRASNLKVGLIAGISLAVSSWANADCTKVTRIDQLSVDAQKKYTATSWTGAYSSSAAPISLGTIILGSGEESLVPAGNTLASASLNFLTGGPAGGYTANQILFKCLLSDADKLFEMYAVNASTADINGKHETTDVPGAYLSAALNIAFRITNVKTGLYYSNRWQERQLEPDEYYNDGANIYIPASAFSDAFFELVKTDDTRYSYGTTRAVFGNSEQQGLVALKVMGGSMGGAIATGSVVSTMDYSNWPGEWSMKNGSTTVIRGSTCLIGDYDQVVQIPPISSGELRTGMTSSNVFRVSLKCDSDAVSGTATNISKPPVAMGFLVSQQNARGAATSLGLISGSGGINYLLDDNYKLDGTGDAASGVGIRILRPQGSPMTLLSDKNILGGGESAGWYGFSDLLSFSGSTPAGGKQYEGIFTASLEELPGLTAKSGSVNAQAQIVVSLQ